MTDEAKLGTWLAKMRQANQGKGRTTFYPACQKLAEDLGQPDMFEPPKTSEEKALEMTKEVIEFYQKHGRYPSARKPKDDS